MKDCTCSYIELHFYTEDGSHTMNAESLNRCVYEYLGIIKEVSSKFQMEVEVEAEPLEEGGIRQWLKFNLPAKETYKAALILALLVDMAKAPITTTIETLVGKCIERILTPRKYESLRRRKQKPSWNTKLLGTKTRRRNWLIIGMSTVLLRALLFPQGPADDLRHGPGLQGQVLRGGDIGIN